MGGKTNFQKKMRGYACVALSNPKSPLNVGSVFRAAGCYGVKLVIVGGERPNNYFHRIPTDTQKYIRHNPVLRVLDIFEALPFDCVPVAVDIIKGAKSLIEYKHPERVCYIFGAEDATLGRHITDRCRDIIYVPTEHCMNLAATANVVLYDRMTKEIQKKT